METNRELNKEVECLKVEHSKIEGLKIERLTAAAVEAIKFLETAQATTFLLQTAQLLATTFASGGKLLLAGNGGSLCDAMHAAEEFTGIFKKVRRALPAIALADPGHLTCIGNDLGYDQVFSRGVEAFGHSGDILIVLTTSGNSPNVVRALESAKAQGLKTIAFLGKGGGRVKGMCDLELIVPATDATARIQEVHMAALHIIIEAVEQLMFD